MACTRASNQPSFSSTDALADCDDGRRGGCDAGLGSGAALALRRSLPDAADEKLPCSQSVSCGCGASCVPESLPSDDDASATAATSMRSDRRALAAGGPACGSGDASAGVGARGRIGVEPGVAPA